MNHELDNLKRNVSLLQLAQSYGMDFKRVGRNEYQTHCPNPDHEDKTPSFNVSTEKNVYHCLGCGIKGTVIDLVMLKENVDTHNAINALKERYPHLVLNKDRESNHKKPLLKKESQSEKPFDFRSPQVQKALNLALRYYQGRLANMPEALNYIQRRNVVCPDLLSYFHLGASDGNLLSKLPKSDQKLVETLKTIGILYSNGKERFQGYLLAPTFAEDHKTILGLYGRSFEEAREIKHMFLPHPRRGLFHPQALSQSDLILTEGLFDCFSFFAHGLRNVTAVMGTNGLHESHIDQILNSSVERLYLCLDPDKAGREAEKRIIEMLERKLEHKKKSLELFRFELPKDQDPNEIAQNFPNPGEELVLLMKRAVKHPLKLIDTRNYSNHESKKTDESLPLSYEEKNGNYIFQLGDRTYTMRGFEKNKPLESLKLFTMVSCGENRFHDNSCDFYSVKSLDYFCKKASLELVCEESIIRSDIKRIIRTFFDKHTETLKSRSDDSEDILEFKSLPQLSKREERILDQYLKSVNFLELVLKDLSLIGLIGEMINKALVYIATISRKLFKPTNVIIRSSFSGGKSTIIDKVCEFVPFYDSRRYSSMSGQSLYYMPEGFIKNKCLVLSEDTTILSALEPLKLLISQGWLSIASTRTNPKTGDLEAKEYFTEGPATVLITSNSLELPEDFLSRFFAVMPDTSVAQTVRIHDWMRERNGIKSSHYDRKEEELKRLHQHIQSRIRPLKVKNPHTHKLKFFSKDQRARRDFDKYINFLKAVALMHQHRKEIKTELNESGHLIEYIEVDALDIAVGNKIMRHALRVSLDEISPVARELSILLKQMVREACKEQEISQAQYRFDRLMIKNYTNWTSTKLRNNLKLLEQADIIRVHKGRQGLSYSYELLLDMHSEDDLMIPLLNAEELLQEGESLPNLSYLDVTASPIPGSRDAKLA